MGFLGKHPYPPSPHDIKEIAHLQDEHSPEQQHQRCDRAGASALGLVLHLQHGDDAVVRRPGLKLIRAAP